MASIEEYRERLAAWVIEEQQRLGLSDRKFAKLFNVTYSTIQDWRKRKLKQPLKDDSINALAHYRQQSPQQVRAWLEGEPQESPADRIRRLEDRVYWLELRIARLDSKIPASDYPGSLRELVCDFLYRSGMTKAEVEAQIASKANRLITSERFWAVCHHGVLDLSHDELTAIALIVPKSDGTLWDYDDLLTICQGRYSVAGESLDSPNMNLE